MPTFPVTVTASYDAARAPGEMLDQLRGWADGQDGRTFVVDRRIAPDRWTASADYLVQAPSAHEAERAAVQQFLAEADAAGIAAPETVIGATGPSR